MSKTLAFALAGAAIITLGFWVEIGLGSTLGGVLFGFIGGTCIGEAILLWQETR